MEPKRNRKEPSGIEAEVNGTNWYPKGTKAEPKEHSEEFTPDGTSFHKMFFKVKKGRNAIN